MTPISQRGDIWLLGKHRLMCGDATVSEDVVKLMDGQQCDFVLTDPPYNCDYEGATKDAIENDKCLVCQNKLIRIGGCTECISGDWSKCG